MTITEHHASGLTPQQIADTTGRSVAYVVGYLRGFTGDNSHLDTLHAGRVDSVAIDEIIHGRKDGVREWIRQRENAGEVL